MGSNSNSRTRAVAHWARAEATGVVLVLHVQPGARRSAVVGLHGDRLKIALAAPPIDGQANDALRRFLAERLGCARAAVELLSGETSREKRVRVSGATLADVERVLQPDEKRAGAGPALPEA